MLAYLAGLQDSAALAWQLSAVQQWCGHQAPGIYALTSLRGKFRSLRSPPACTTPNPKHQSFIEGVSCSPHRLHPPSLPAHPPHARSCRPVKWWSAPALAVRWPTHWVPPAAGHQLTSHPKSQLPQPTLPPTPTCSAPQGPAAVVN
jgi:hypothetical protein